MLPTTHFLFPFVIGLTLNKLGIISYKLALVAGIVGILIDLDHYIEHIMHAKTNKYSLKSTWNNSIKLHRFYQRSFIHHLSGIIILTIILFILFWYNWKISLTFSIGYYSHLLLDYLHLKYYKFIRFRINHTYFKESYKEIYLNLILIIILIFLIFL